MKYESLTAKIAAYVALTDSGCLEWTGRIDKAGYGRVMIGSRSDGSRKTGYLAHRAVWSELTGQQIPDRMTLDHLCRNTRCVLPDHLEVVSLAENISRAAIPRSTCPNGHPYDEANTYRHRGIKYCRACNRAAQRALKARHAGAAL